MTEVLSDVIEVHHDTDPEALPLWYEQFLGLPDATRKRLADLSLKQIKESKPAAYEFIKTFKCELVGITPNIAYALCSSKEGDTSVSWIHAFSMPTLLYWSADGEFGFFINANLKFNDTVLNKLNDKEHVRGFTG